MTKFEAGEGKSMPILFVKTDVRLLPIVSHVRCILEDSQIYDSERDVFDLAYLICRMPNKGRTKDGLVKWFMDDGKVHIRIYGE